MEIQVLKFLHFRLSVPTTKTFLKHYTRYETPALKNTVLAM
ncbi:unnamed protein product [Brassica oleracea]